MLPPPTAASAADVVPTTNVPVGAAPASAVVVAGVAGAVTVTVTTEGKIILGAATDVLVFSAAVEVPVTIGETVGNASVPVAVAVAVADVEVAVVVVVV